MISRRKFLKFIAGLAEPARDPAQFGLFGGEDSDD